jgi:hypothetical protein
MLSIPFRRRKTTLEMKLAAVCLSLIAFAWICSSCSAESPDSPRIWFNDAHQLSQQPPPARTMCERVFFDRLMRGIQADMTSIPSPTEDEVVAVYNACSAEQLLAANERFAFAIGPPGGQLVELRLFNGPASPSQLAQACTDSALSRTTACRTQPAPKRSG